jgi:hypothetical protein
MKNPWYYDSESALYSPSTRKKSKKVFVFAIGLFSDGNIYMTPNDSFACAEQNLIDLTQPLRALEVYVYKVSYDVSSGRPTILIPTTIDPCCLCKSLLSNIYLSRPTSLDHESHDRESETWNFWGRGELSFDFPIPLPESNPWRSDCEEKFVAKRKFVWSLLTRALLS